MMSWFLVLFYVQLFAVCIWLELRWVPDLHLPGCATKMWRIFQHYSVLIHILKYKKHRGHSVVIFRMFIQFHLKKINSSIL